MADDRHYVGGDNYLLDDLSGFKIRASKARIIPGGQTGNLAVAPQRWEPQQPQDFVRGVADDQTVALSRPRQQNHFVIVGTFVTAPSARLTYTITVDSSVGFSVGDNVMLMLDTGENFLTSIGGISGSSITLGTFLPATVGTSYGDPIENSLLFLNTGAPPSTGLWNDSGTLALFQHDGGYPTSPVGLAAGSVWDNGLAIGVVAGGSGSGQSYTFGTVTAGQLLFAGAGGLTTSLPAAGQIWNNGGELSVA